MDDFTTQALLMAGALALSVLITWFVCKVIRFGGGDETSDK